MIARIWTGATHARDGEAYQRYMEDVAHPGYSNIPGNRGVLMLRRELPDDRSEFTMVTLWDDIDAITRFAGDEASTARFYPEDDRYLIEREDRARHYVAYGPEYAPQRATDGRLRVRSRTAAGTWHFCP